MPQDKIENKSVKNALLLTRRFGVMAAVAPQKVQCEFGSLPPARSSVEAATSPSRLDVICNPGHSAPHKLTMIERKK
jgi:hypothetical protein